MTRPLTLANATDCWAATGLTHAARPAARARMITRGTLHLLENVRGDCAGRSKHRSRWAVTRLRSGRWWIGRSRTKRRGTGFRGGRTIRRAGHPHTNGLGKKTRRPSQGADKRDGRIARRLHGATAFAGWPMMHGAHGMVAMCAGAFGEINGGEIQEERRGNQDNSRRLSQQPYARQWSAHASE